VDQVRGELGIAGVHRRVVRVARVGGGQHAADRAEQRRVPFRAELLTEHAADQRVHREVVAGRVEITQAVAGDQAQRGPEPALDPDRGGQLGG
jgi:hypothetical protein